MGALQLLQLSVGAVRKGSGVMVSERERCGNVEEGSRRISIATRAISGND